MKCIEINNTKDIGKKISKPQPKIIKIIPSETPPKIKFYPMEARREETYKL
jgi:hypothetical protein